VKKELDIQQLQQSSLKHKKKSEEGVSDEFIKEHLPIIEAIAANVVGTGKMPPGIEFHDLVSWGVEGLIKAWNNFDPEKGSQFKTYAYYRIRGEIFDKIRIEWRYRNPTEYKSQRNQAQDKIADLAEIALNQLEDVHPDKIKEGVDQLISNSAMMCLVSIENLEIISEMEGTKDPQIELIENKSNALWEEIKNLEDDEQRIVELFYIQGFKQKEIAQRLNMSRSTVCRLHMKALEKLRKQLKGKI
jgi:RNA polymerase sigma factor for flagellar operon FliA